MISLDDLKNCLSSFYKELFQKDIEDGNIGVPTNDDESCWVNLCKFEDFKNHRSSIDLYCQTGWEDSSPISPDDIVYAFALYRNGKDYFKCDSDKELHKVIIEDNAFSKYYDESYYDSDRIKEKQIFVEYEYSSNRKGRSNGIYASYYFKQSETRKDDCLRFFLKELVDNNFLKEEEIEKIKQSILGKYLEDKNDTKERQYFIAKITKAPEIFAESVIHNHWRMQQRYDHEDYANAVTTNLNNAKQVQKGDILILDNGGGLYAYGVVKESPKNVIAKASLQGIIKKHAHIYLDKDGIISFDDCSAYYEQNYKGCNSDWSQFIDVERWESFCPKNPVSNYGVQDAAGGLSVHSIFSVKSEWAKEKIKELDGHFATNRTEADKMREDNKSLLEQKKNIILQGAPGTGKTYATAALALSMTDPNFSAFDDHALVMARYEELRKEGLIAFTTFHQSLDYEDFVEGIKPIKPDEGEMYYKIEDGIFKIMSRVATNPQQVKQAKTLDSAFDDLIQDIIDGKVKTLSMKNGGSSAELSVSSQMTIKWKTSDGDIDVNCVSKDRLLKLCEVYDSKEKIGAITNINESIRKAIGGCNSSYYWAVANYILEKVDKEKVSNEKPRNYVLIIDEINRGNVSKIFGELISLLEADKRVGGDHPLTVTLPYSKESFSVPSNLYIIGTMNTTDRSVGSIDYAVRRRFAFVTLEADENKVPEGNARNLFNAVKNFLNKSKYDMDIEDLMVGHSYFMDANNLQMKWQYEILPLLMEYHKDGIIKESPLNGFSEEDAKKVKVDYDLFIKKWPEKKTEEAEK